MEVPFRDKIYVALQFILFAAYLFEWDSLAFVLPENLRCLALMAAIAGVLLILIAFFQLNKNLSPFPSPTKTSELKTGGAFAFSRHPIYSGIIFISFGMAIWLGSGYKLLISLLFLALFYAKSKYEEERLEIRFSEYAEYKNTTGRFFPKFRGRI